MKIVYSSKFLKSFEKLPNDIQDLFRLKEIIFRENPFDFRLGTHKLKGAPNRCQEPFLGLLDFSVVSRLNLLIIY